MEVGRADGNTFEAEKQMGGGGRPAAAGLRGERADARCVCEEGGTGAEHLLAVDAEA